MHTFYDILNIDKDATKEDILEAYRKKVMEVHPDRGGNPIDFMNVRKAYEILSNQEMRIKYDKWINKKEFETKRSLWIVFMQSFLNNICKDKNLNLKIISLLKSGNSTYIYQSLNNTPSKDMAAEITKKCLQVIRITYPNLNTQCLELDSICNKIILMSKPNANEGKRTNIKKRIIITICCIIAWFVGLSLLFGLNDKNYTENAITADDIPTTSTTAAYDESSESLTSTSGQIEQTSETPSYEETILQTGDCPYEQYYGKGIFNNHSLSELELINESGRDAVVLLCSRNNNIIRNVFIKSGSTYKMKHIPSTECIIKVMYGHGWNKDKINNNDSPIGGFMEDVSFSKTEWSNSFSFVPQKIANSYNYPTYTVTLHKIINGNLKSEDISEEEFFS